MIFSDNIKKILALALPMAGTQFVNVGSGFLCMTMLARLGHQVLAASALIFSIQLSVMVTGMSILFSLSVLIGHAYGEKNYVRIGRFVQQGWLISLLLSIPIMIFFWKIKLVLIFLGQSIVLANLVQDYFHVYLWGVIPAFLSTCNQQFGYSIHKKLLVIFSSFMSIIVLLITAYGLIFGKNFGFLMIPKLGVAGLGYAMVASYIAFFMVSGLFFCYEKSFKKYELLSFLNYKNYKNNKKINLEFWVNFKSLFKIGWPICVQMGGEMLSFFVSMIMIGWMGVTALGAFQVVNQYYCLIIIPLFALSQASGILVGQARGAKEFHKIKEIGRSSIRLGLIASLGVACLFIVAPKYLASFYINVNNNNINNNIILHLIILIFSIIAFSQILDSMRNILIGLLRGLFDTRFAMLMSLLNIWIIGMPLSYVFAFIFHWGVAGFVFGGLLGMLAGAGIMLYRWMVLSRAF